MAQNTVQTKKGTLLPLTNLKGKDYLMVAYRLQWLTEDEESYTIDTLTMDRTEQLARVQAVITVYNKEGKVVRRATARKAEHSKDFPDFEEKAETGAIGRALAMLGYGTQHAIADLDEGTRIVDAPVTNTKSSAATVSTPPSPVAANAGSSSANPQNSAPRRSTSFTRRSTAPVKTTAGTGAAPKPAEKVTEQTVLGGSVTPPVAAATEEWA